MTRNQEMMPEIKETKKMPEYQKSRVTSTVKLG